ncbi:MAG: biotin/lipoyl-containing protein, partial [Mycobacteriales bacterium]
MPTLTSPLQGTVVACVEAGSAVRAGQAVVVVESMKMEHAVAATEAGTVGVVHVAVGDTVVRDQRLAELAPAGEVAVQDEQAAPVERHALERLRGRRAAVRDEARPEQVQRRHDRGGRTARENVADLVDEGSWVEYGALAVAAQRGRRTMEELVARTPADGVLAGFATVGGAPVAVVSYDYTVLAGTQGMVGHRKQDRLFELVARQ